MLGSGGLRALSLPIISTAEGDHEYTEPGCISCAPLIRIHPDPWLLQMFLSQDMSSHPQVLVTRWSRAGKLQAGPGAVAAALSLGVLGTLQPGSGLTGHVIQGQQLPGC